MARANPTWGEERIADGLFLKLGLAVSPCTVGLIFGTRGRPTALGPPALGDVVRNHAHAVLACDFS
jgi:hypothetical protein